MFLKIKARFWVLLISGILMILPIGYLYEIFVLSSGTSYKSEAMVVGNYLDSPFADKHIDEKFVLFSSFCKIDNRKTFWKDLIRQKETITFQSGEQKRIVFERLIFPYDYKSPLLIWDFFLASVTAISAIVFLVDLLFIVFSGKTKVLD